MIFKPEPEKLWQLIRHEQCCEKLHLDHHLRHRTTGGSFPNRAILNLSARLQFPVCQPLNQNRGVRGIALSFFQHAAWSSLGCIDLRGEVQDSTGGTALFENFSG
jgi:hypothetical protein